VAYPFTSFPTVKEFIDRVTRHYNGAVRTISTRVQGKKGTHTIRYLERSLPNGYKKAVLPDLKDSQRLSPKVLRSLCKRLDLPVDHFGLPLD